MQKSQIALDFCIKIKKISNDCRFTLIKFLSIRVATREANQWFSSEFYHLLRNSYLKVSTQSRAGIERNGIYFSFFDTLSILDKYLPFCLGPIALMTVQPLVSGSIQCDNYSLSKITANRDYF